MNALLRKFVFLLICLMPLWAIAQDSPAPKSQEPLSKRMHRSAAKKKWKEKRELEKGKGKKVREHHKRIQTKEVRKRMRRNKTKSKNINDNKKTFFLIKWFSKSS